MSALISVHGGLRDLWSPRVRLPHEFDCSRRASVKDVIESLGIPHTEVYAIVVNDKDVDFAYLPVTKDHVHVFPAVPPIDVRRPSRLRPAIYHEIRFLVDTNVARLAGLLRLFGFDAASDPDATDPELAERAARESRILLSRDRGLLKRKNILHGRLVRSQFPREQLCEITSFYGLTEKLNPWSRCARCNGLLRGVDPEEVWARLEPLTKKYYSVFSRCTKCGQIYWKGSHMKTLRELLVTVRNVSPDGG